MTDGRIGAWHELTRPVEGFGRYARSMPLNIDTHASLHRYRARCEWSGSTGAGYEAYDRRHTVSAPPVLLSFDLSADPAFHGDQNLLNPEQLVVLAAASCQLLSFLTVAARARIDVLEYHDEAEGVMPEDDLPMRLTSILLRPTIRVASGTSEERVTHLVEVAHRECYIANSLRTEIRVEPTVITGPNAAPR
jgi:organic hydroperoxide reductase OsmC/OhrA